MSENVRHGLSRSPEYHAYKAMMARCYRVTHPKYWRYGARGITVCARWRNDFLSFVADVGMRPFPTASIGRINNDGNYTPENVRWETPKQQMRNTSRSRFLTINGQTKTVSEWSEISGIHWKTLWGRMSCGFSDDDLLRPPGSFPGRKITLEIARQIRGERNSGLRYEDVAVKYGVSVSLVGQIYQGIIWKENQ